MNRGERPGPDFFVVGAPKTGTTSLYHYLRQHPEIFLPERKELHWFSHPEVLETYYDVECVSDETAYHDLFAGRTGERAAGDISPSYLHHPEAPERIRRYDADARIVIVLRDPVDRCISHYLMDVRRGFQRLPLETFLEPDEGNRPYHREYVLLGLYADAVERYLDVFGRERVLVLDYDALVADAAGFVATLCRFLGVDAGFVPDLTERHNAFRMPRTTLHYYVRNNPVLGRLARGAPESLKRAARALLFRGDGERPQMERERRRLADFYRDDLARLGGLVGGDFASWLHPGR